MQFDKIEGEIDPSVIAAAEKKITDVLLELGTGIDNNSLVSKLGGDPLIFALIVPILKIATLKVPTLATNGRELFINPHYILDKGYLGIRLSVNHEGVHALFMHPQRRGNRDKRLWNIAVDYIANGMLMDDLLIRAVRNNGGERKIAPAKAKAIMHEQFTRGLGNYCTIQQCQQMFLNPLGKIDGMENWTPEKSDPNSTEIEFKLFYADPNLAEEMKRPEKVYDLLYKVCPRCPECGKLGTFALPTKPNAPSNPQKAQSNANQNPPKDNQLSNAQSHNHQPSNGSGSGDTNGPQDNSTQLGPSTTPGDGALGNRGKSGCQTCASGYNVLNFGDTLDEHMDSIGDPEELAQRVNNAIETAKAMAGNVPKQIEEALAKLSQPRISFPDIIRSQLMKSRNGSQRNDWSKFRSRPLSMGLMIPKKKSVIVNAICLLDTSASMKAEAIALGLSQLQALDDRAEITIVPCDAVLHWDKITKIKRCNVEELSKVKVCGRGGTQIASFFSEYEKKLGKADFLVLITDGLIDKRDVEKMVNPGIPTYWLIIGNSDFKAPFGRTFSLLD